MLTAPKMLCIKVEIPRAGLVFRGALDSNWNVKGVLEKKLLPLPLTLSLCGLLNHPKQSFQMGAGLIMGQLIFSYLHPYTFFQASWSPTLNIHNSPPSQFSYLVQRKFVISIQNLYQDLNLNCYNNPNILLIITNVLKLKAF